MYYLLAQGSGFGDPLERSTEAVTRDVTDGVISSEAARIAYGVVVDTSGLLDEMASEAARAAARASRLEAPGLACSDYDID